MKTCLNSLKRTAKAGFTLIELLTVIAVIAILAGILIPAVGVVQSKARKAKTKSQFSQYVTALEAFKGEYGFYPVFASGGGGSQGDSVVELHSGNNSDTFYGILTGRDFDTGNPISSSSEAFRYNRRKLSFYSFSDQEIADKEYASQYRIREGSILTASGNWLVEYVADSNLNGIIVKENLTSYKTTAEDDLGHDFQGGVVFYAKKNDDEGFDFVSSVAGWD